MNSTRYVYILSWVRLAFVGAVCVWKIVLAAFCLQILHRRNECLISRVYQQFELQDTMRYESQPAETQFYDGIAVFRFAEKSKEFCRFRLSFNLYH